MTKTFKDRSLGLAFGLITVFSGVILGRYVNNNDVRTIKIEEKLKTDIKIEVKEELKPEFDKKLDKEIFNNYTESNGRYMDLQYKTVNDKIDLLLDKWGITYIPEKNKTINH